MPPSRSTTSLRDAQPPDDQGSEAAYGFVYQAHCIACLCLEMISAATVVEVICEFHEDVTEVLVGGSLRLCQVKKRESADAWSIDLLKEAIAKLLTNLEYKDVGALIIYGNGRPTTRGSHSLGGLMALLDRPEADRDGDWADALRAYAQHLSSLLGPPFDVAAVERGLRLLQIRLTMPHPEAIELKNVELLVGVVRELWGVSVELSVAKGAYARLYQRVCEASVQPKQPRSVKCIPAHQVKNLLLEALRREGCLAADQRMLLDTHRKLINSGLEIHLPYVLGRRMDALQVKFELGLESMEWRDLRDEIAVGWEDRVAQVRMITGARLWASLRGLLAELGKQWAATRGDPMGPAFAEGVFFDMLAICEVDLRG